MTWSLNWMRFDNTNSESLAPWIPCSLNWLRGFPNILPSCVTIRYIRMSGTHHKWRPPMVTSQCLYLPKISMTYVKLWTIKRFLWYYQSGGQLKSPYLRSTFYTFMSFVVGWLYFHWSYICIVPRRSNHFIIHYTYLRLNIRHIALLGSAMATLTWNPACG